MKELTLLAERAVAGGFSIARHEGKVVLVAGAIPGERVRVRVDRATRQVSFATTVEVLEPSPFRRTPRQDVGCGGLAWAHVEYAHQLAIKASVIADTFQRLGKVTLEAPVTVAPSAETAYRLRARLHVSRRRLGFFREGTHDLCDPASSGQLSDAALLSLSALSTWIGTALDRVEAVTLAENVSGRERVAHLDLQPGAVWPQSLDRQPLPAGMTGVTTARAGRLVLLAGAPYVHDTAKELCGSLVDLPEEVSWSRSGGAFFQGNRSLTGALVAHVLRLVASGPVADLYSGVGLFAVALAARGAEVLAVEGDPLSGEDLTRNAGTWPTLTVQRSSVEAALFDLRADQLQTAVLDPPRAGVSPEALTRLAELRVGRLVYVSCDTATLARDGRRLVDGGYRMTDLAAFDMFPNTPHVEAVAVFDYAG